MRLFLTDKSIQSAAEMSVSLFCFFLFGDLPQSPWHDPLLPDRTPLRAPLSCSETFYPFLRAPVLILATEFLSSLQYGESQMEDTTLDRDHSLRTEKQ